MVIKHTLEAGSRICLVDFRLGGHHPLYLSCFARSFLQLGYLVDIYSPEVSTCREKIIEALPSLDLSNVDFVHTDASTHKQTRVLGCRSFFKLIKLEQEINAQERAGGFQYELVFFAFLDDLTHIDFKLPYLFKLPFTKRFSGLLVAPLDRTLKEQTFLSNLLTTSFIERKRANFHEIGLLTENLQAEVEDKLHRKTTIYPDFCLETSQTGVDSKLKNNLLQRKRGRIVTGLFGSIFPRKSLELLLECVRQSDPNSHFFIVAGKIAWDLFSDEEQRRIKEVIAKPPENLLICDEWIESEAVFDSVFQTCDVIFAYYRGFKKSSNIITKGAFYNIPVIVNESFLLGERVRKYKLGYAESEAGVIELYKKEKWQSFEFDKELVEQFRASHSVNRIPEIFANLLGE